MDYRRKYLGLKTNKTETKVLSNENKEKDSSKNNSYLQRILEKNKAPKYSPINITSYNENLPSFKVSIRDIFSTEENKQKAINYVIQKRNEEKYGLKNGNQRKNVINNREDNAMTKYNNYNNISKVTTNNNNNNVFNSNNNQNKYINNRYDNYFQKQRQNQNLINNNENFINDKSPKYTYFYSRRNKQNINSDINNNENLSTNNNYLNIRDNKRINKVENNINNNSNNININGRKYIIKYNANNTNNTNNTNNSKIEISPYSSHTNTNITYNPNIKDNNTYRKIKKYEIFKKYDKVQNSDIKPSNDDNKFKRYEFIRKRENDKNILINSNAKTDQSNNSNLKSITLKKSYDILPFNMKKNENIYYSKYSKKDNVNSNDKYTEKKNNYNYIIGNSRIPFKDYKNLRITKNSFQLNINKDKNKFRYVNKYKKNKYIKERPIEINLLGLPDTYINKEVNNLKLNSKLKNKNNLTFKNINEIADYINKEVDEPKKIELFRIKNIKQNKNDNLKEEIDNIKSQLNEEINKNKEYEKSIKNLK